MQKRYSTGRPQYTLGLFDSSPELITNKVLSDDQKSNKRCAVADKNVTRRALKEAVDHAVAEAALRGITPAELHNFIAAGFELYDPADQKRFAIPPLYPAPIGLAPLSHILMMRKAGVAMRMRKIPAWVTWSLCWRAGGDIGISPGRWEKRFFNPDGSRVRATSLKVGGHLQDAIAAFERKRHIQIPYKERYPKRDFGVGFALKRDYGIVAIDLDNVVNPRTGVIDPVARAIVEQIDSHTEVSPSMRGLRIFAYGVLPANGLREKIQPHSGKFGIYDHDKVVTVTGYNLLRHTRGIRDRQSELMDFYELYIKPSA